MRQWLLNVWRMCLGLVEVAAKVRRSRERAQLRFEQLEDRTVPATFLVNDIHPAGSSNPSWFAQVNGTLFFAADDGTSDVELWSWDGTSATPVANINPGGSSNPSWLTNVNGTLFFAADDGTNGVGLWSWDGTAATPVANINSVGISNPTWLTYVDGTLFFAADDGTHGVELWSWDGTSATLVYDINPGVSSSNPSWLTNVDGTLFFAADDGTNGVGLWSWDGTAATPVANINSVGISNPTWLTYVDGTLFFAADDGTHGVELWSWYGGSATLVYDINPGVSSSNPSWLTNVDGTLFFAADDGTHGVELWSWDGTSATLVDDINPGVSSSNPSWLTNVNGTLFFAADDGTDVELWSWYGGSAALVTDINPGGSSNPTWLTNVNGTLFFAADDGTTGVELWATDEWAPTITSVTGPDAGTYIVGQTLDFTVVFSEAVAVTGTPRLVLTIGSTTRYADYDPSSSSSANLVFRYPVQSGDLDPDGIAFAFTSIDLNGGTITDVPGNNAVLTFTPPDTSGVLVDGVAPTITSVTGPAAGTYIVGQTLDFTVDFDDIVNVTGTPRLVLTIGSTTQYATYQSGSGTSTLVFRYTVQAGDEDSDGIAVASSIDLNGGTIKDTNGNDAVLTFTPPDTSSVLVDGVAPTITSVTGPAAGTYIVGQNLDFTVDFDDIVNVTGTPRLVLTIGSTTQYATYQSGSGTSTLVFSYTVQAGDEDSDGIAVASSIDLNGGTIKDTNGNDAVLSFTAPDTSGVLVDGVAPTITSVSGPAAGTYIVGQHLDFTVQFDETVVVDTTGGTPQLQLTIGSTTQYATYLSGSGTSTLTFRYTVQSGDLDSDGIAVASPINLNGGTIKDTNGNNAALTFTPPDTSGVLVDGVAPTITSVTGPAAGTYIVGQNLDFTVVFSEAVVVTGTPRLVLTIGSATQYATYQSGTGTSTLTFRYTVQAGDEDSDGIAVASPIDLNGGTIKDTNGNNAALTFTPPDTSGVLVDGVAPTITSVTGPAAGTYIVGQNLDFTVDFDDIVNVTGTPRLVLTIGSATQYATYQSGTGTSTLTFRYTVQAGDEDSDGIAVASPIDLNGGTIKDTNGNDAVLSFTAPDTSGVLVDGVAPTITSVTGPAAGTYIVGQNLDFTVQFDDTVVVDTTGGTPRLVLTIGSTTQYATYQSGSGTSTLTFRYTVQAGDEDSDGIAVASPIDLNGGTIKDTNGNDAVLSFTAPDTSGVLVDGVAPTITSVTGPAAGTYIVGQNLDFTVQFDDIVNVTGTPRLVLTIGSTTQYATYQSGSGTSTLVFSYTVQAGDEDSDGIAVASPIDLNGGTIKDTNGNDAVLSFTAPDTSGVLVDGVAPTITSVTGPTAGTYIVGQNLDFTVDFDDIVNVTGTPRLVLTIGSATQYATYQSGSGTSTLVFSYTVQAGDEDSDGIAVASSIDLNGGTIKDTNGNDAVLTFTPPDTSGVLVDGVAPTITSVTGPAAGTYIVGQNLDFTVDFDDIVNVTGTPRLVLTIGSATQYATYQSGTGTSTLTFRYTVQAGDEDSDGIAVALSIDLNGGTIKDTNGNDAVLSFTAPDTSGVLVDGVAPTITSVTGPAAGTYIVGQNLDFTVQFDDTVVVDTTGGTPRLVLTIGSTTRYAEYDPSSSSSANLVFRYPVQSGDLDPDGIAFAFTSIDLNGGTITDVPGNNAVLTFTPPDTSGVLVDGVAPTITSVTGPAAGTYIVGQNLDFTVVFSEAVKVTGTPRLQLTIGSTTEYATYQGGTGTSTLVFRYTVKPGDLDSDGIAVASSIGLNGGTITDVPGNDAVLTFTPPDTSGVLVDGVAPTITSVTGPAAGTYIVGQHLDFTVVFSEAVAVTGTPRLQLTIGSTNEYATYQGGTGTSTLVFRYTVKPGDLDSDGIAVASTSIDLNGGTITDVPGNDAVLTFTPPDTSGVLVDGVAPTITSVTGPTAGTYIVGQNLDFTVVFSESGGSEHRRWHAAAATDHRQHDPLRHVSERQRHEHSLTFRYTVQAGDEDTDGIAVASTPIDLNGGTITDVPGNDAVLTFTPPDTSGVLVVRVGPTITSVTGPAAGTYIVGQHLDFTVVFSEAVAVTGTPRLVLTIGSTTRYATYLSGTGEHTDLPLHGASGRPGHRWHCRRFAD
jgi:ELWxxDGT repeat protein